jgi:hypothetical protein
MGPRVADLDGPNGGVDLGWRRGSCFADGRVGNHGGEHAHHPGKDEAERDKSKNDGCKHGKNTGQPQDAG